eukprot:2988476-Pyramimonas_sp.AAC.1
MADSLAVVRGQGRTYGSHPRNASASLPPVAPCSNPMGLSPPRLGCPPVAHHPPLRPPRTRGRSLDADPAFRTGSGSLQRAGHIRPHGLPSWALAPQIQPPRASPTNSPLCSIGPAPGPTAPPTWRYLVCPTPCRLTLQKGRKSCAYHSATMDSCRRSNIPSPFSPMRCSGRGFQQQVRLVRIGGDVEEKPKRVYQQP